MKNKIKEVEEFDNVKEIIYDACKRYANQYAFVIKHKKDNKEIEYENITYKRLLEDINRMGTAMISNGYFKKRIAVIGKNRYEWAVTHLSTLLGGGVSVPLDKDLQLDELESSLIRSEAECLVFDPKLKDKILQIRSAGKTNVKEYICMEKDEDFRCVRELLEIGDKLLKKGKNDYIDAKIDENEMNILLFTSGTTSQSKAVMLSQKNIASNIYAMRCVEDIRDTDTNIAFLPFHHIFGSTNMIMMLASGVKTVFPDGLKYIKQNLNEYKVTIFIGVPVLIEAIYKTIMKEIEKQGKTKLITKVTKISDALLKVHIDLRRILFKQVIGALGGKLRFIISGGAPADPAILKGFNSLGIKTVQGYGLTETSPVICSQSEITQNNDGSVGLPMINDTIEIYEPDEEGIGQIRVKGPNIMLGYYNMPEITKEVLKDGWFYTGDLGYKDKRGYLYITGRSKNMIVLKNGKKIFPEEIESLISQLELVEECMVFGMPDKKDKTDIKLSVKIVYNKDEAKDKYPDLDEKGLYNKIWENIKELNKKFPQYKHIKNLILTDKEMIKTTTKKIKRQEEMKVILKESEEK